MLSYGHSHRPAISQAPPILPYSCWPKPMNTIHRVVSSTTYSLFSQLETPARHTKPIAHTSCRRFSPMNF